MCLHVNWTFLWCCIQLSKIAAIFEKLGIIKLKICYFFKNIISSVSARKLKCSSSAWLGLEPSQLGLTRAGKFQLELISTIYLSVFWFSAYQISGFLEKSWFCTILLAFIQPTKPQVWNFKLVCCSVIGWKKHEMIKFCPESQKAGTLE